MTMKRFQTVLIERLIRAACIGAALTATSVAHAQCDQWDPFVIGAFNGVNGSVSAAIVYQGDLVVAGSFTGGGGQTLNNIARWNGSNWQPFVVSGNAGVNFAVMALAIYNDDLIAGGNFTTAGGITVNRIARWDGETWHPLESGGQIGVNSTVEALAVVGNELIAGGTFATAGGQIVNQIARWDGTSWSPFAVGAAVGMNANVRALGVHNGQLIAGGNFTTAGGVIVNRIARWDGGTWHAYVVGSTIGIGGSGNEVFAIAVYDGQLHIGGNFSLTGGQTYNRIARWTGSAWAALISNGFNGIGGASVVRTLTVHDNQLVIGGAFSEAGGETANGIVRWNGTVMTPFVVDGHNGVGPSNPTVRALTTHNGALVVGGIFTTAGGQAASGVVRWGCSTTPVLGDLNDSGTVDVQDLLILLGAWGTCPKKGPCPADLNNSGAVDVQDLLILLANWG